MCLLNDQQRGKASNALISTSRFASETAYHVIINFNYLITGVYQGHTKVHRNSLQHKRDKVYILCRTVNMTYKNTVLMKMFIS